MVLSSSTYKKTLQNLSRPKRTDWYRIARHNRWFLSVLIKPGIARSLGFHNVFGLTTVSDVNCAELVPTEVKIGRTFHLLSNPSKPIAAGPSSTASVLAGGTFPSRTPPCATNFELVALGGRKVLHDARNSNMSFEMADNHSITAAGARLF